MEHVGVPISIVGKQAGTTTRTVVAASGPRVYRPFANRAAVSGGSAGRVEIAGASGNLRM